MSALVGLGKGSIGYQKLIRSKNAVIRLEAHLLNFDRKLRISISSSTTAAAYDNVSMRGQLTAAKMVREEINQGNKDTSTRTGSQICLVDEAPRFETVIRTAMKTPASSLKVTTPAEHKDVQEQKLVRRAQ